MYHRLFNAVSDCVVMLQKAQAETEETYIEAKAAPVVRLTATSDDKEV